MGVRIDPAFAIIEIAVWNIISKGMSMVDMRRGLITEMREGVCIFMGLTIVS